LASPSLRPTNTTLYSVTPAPPPSLLRPCAECPPCTPTNTTLYSVTPAPPPSLLRPCPERPPCTLAPRRDRPPACVPPRMPPRRDVGVCDGMKHASSALCVRSFLMHTHTCSLSPTLTHTINTRRRLSYSLSPRPWPFLLSPQNTRSFHTHEHATPQHVLLHIQHTNSLHSFPPPLSFSPLPRSCPSMHLSLPHLWRDRPAMTTTELF
jgi:hypothetical protein